MLSELLKKIPSFKSAPNIALGVIINPPFTDYFVTTAPIINGILSCFERLKTDLTIPYYFNPYFDPYLTVGADLYSNTNLVTTFSEKWKSSLIKTNLTYAGITIYYYVFADAFSILEQEIQIIMSPSLERQQKEIKSALKQASSKAESDKKQLRICPMIQYNNEFLDEKWNLVEKCAQQSDNEDGWYVVETYEVIPITIAPFRNSI